MAWKPCPHGSGSLLGGPSNERLPPPSSLLCFSVICAYAQICPGQKCPQLPEPTNRSCGGRCPVGSCRAAALLPRGDLAAFPLPSSSPSPPGWPASRVRCGRELKRSGRAFAFGFCAPRQSSDGPLPKGTPFIGAHTAGKTPSTQVDVVRPTKDAFSSFV